jgi:Arc/MetJ-type ribon-helix-helix transcriptional regulator
LGEKTKIKKAKKNSNSNMKLVTVLLPEAQLNGLDDLVRTKMYESRSSVIRNAVRDLLKKELYYPKTNTKE